MWPMRAFTSGSLPGRTQAASKTRPPIPLTVKTLFQKPHFLRARMTRPLLFNVPLLSLVPQSLVHQPCDQNQNLDVPQTKDLVVRLP